jgi:hypothetical protein
VVGLIILRKLPSEIGYVITFASQFHGVNIALSS